MIADYTVIFFILHNFLQKLCKILQYTFKIKYDTLKTTKPKTLKTPIIFGGKIMQFKIKDILNSKEIKNNSFFNGSVELALLNALYKDNQISDREYREIKERTKKAYNIY